MPLEFQRQRRAIVRVRSAGFNLTHLGSLLAKESFVAAEGANRGTDAIVTFARRRRRPCGGFQLAQVLGERRFIANESLVV